MFFLKHISIYLFCVSIKCGCKLFFFFYILVNLEKYIFMTKKVLFVDVNRQ
jgi:hypothetical protein